MEHCIAATLLLLIQQCLCNFPDLSQKVPRSERNITDQLKPLLRAAIIKQEILRHLGIADSPRYHQTTPTYKEKKTNQESDDRLTPYKMTNVASYHSEPPDNFTDENIIQFRLFTRGHGKEIEVNNVNLLVRIKLRKTKKDKKKQRVLDSKRKRRRKNKKNFKEIRLLVSNVTSDGKPDTLITSVKSKLRKTKSLKLSLPREMIQKALESSKRTVQFFIQCDGCDRRTKMILVHKKRRQKLTKTGGTRQPKLHKRRPILFVYSHLTHES